MRGDPWGRAGQFLVIPCRGENGMDTGAYAARILQGKRLLDCSTAGERARPSTMMNEVIVPCSMAVRQPVKLGACGSLASPPQDSHTSQCTTENSQSIQLELHTHPCLRPQQTPSPHRPRQAKTPPKAAVFQRARRTGPAERRSGPSRRRRTRPSCRRTRGAAAS